MSCCDGLSRWWRAATTTHDSREAHLRVGPCPGNSEWCARSPKLDHAAVSDVASEACAGARAKPCLHSDPLQFQPDGGGMVFLAGPTTPFAVETLPCDVIIRCLSFNGVVELLVGAAAASSWRSLCSDPAVWEVLRSRLENVLATATDDWPMRGAPTTLCSRRALLAEPTCTVALPVARHMRSVDADTGCQDARTVALQLSRRVCGLCNCPHAEEPDRCRHCGRRWARPVRSEVAEELRAARSWRTGLACLECCLPEGCTVSRARVCFASELHGCRLGELVEIAARTGARYFSAIERCCYTLLALRISRGIIGVVTDFVWRSRPSHKGFGEGSTDCFVFSVIDGVSEIYRCRRSRGPIMRYTGEALEVGPVAPETHSQRLSGGSSCSVGQVSDGPALVVDATMGEVRSSPSPLFGSPRLTSSDREAAVLSVLCVSWAHLQAEAVEESLHALSTGQDSFMLNFISSSVRSQLAAKAGSAWC